MKLHVLSILPCIPRGQVTTYGDLAKFLGVPKNARQVGKLAGSNPLPIICPCYRVVASDGKLTGYSAKGGIVTKAKLLEKDGIQVSQSKVVHLSKVRWDPAWHSYFLAVGLDEKNKTFFRKAVTSLKKILGKDVGSVSFQNGDMPHATLYYVGNASLGDLAALVAKVRKFKMPNQKSLGKVAFSKAGFFGSAQARFVGYLQSSHNEKALRQLRDRLMAHFKIKSDKPFVPHVTLFRVKDQKTFSRYEPKIAKVLETVALEVSLEQITLYGSVGKNTQVPLVTFP